MKSKRLSILLSIAVCIVIAGVFYFLSIQPKDKRRILVIQSYEPTYEKYADYNESLVKTFRESGIDPQILTLYVDCEAYFSKEELAHTVALLDSAEKFNPDIIIVNHDQAAYDVLACNHPLTYSKPIVFAGVNYPNWELIRKHKNVTGFVDKIDMITNVNFIKDLYHLSKIRVFSVMDSTFIDRKIMHDATIQLAGKHIVGFGTPTISQPQQDEMFRDQNYDMLIKYKARMYDDNDKGFFLWPLYAKGYYYLQLKRDFTTVNIGNMNSNPSFTAINPEFDCNKNLLGGYFTTIETQAAEGASSAIRILQGTPAYKIPISYSKKEYVIDWKSLSHNNLTEKDIPSYCRIVNFPFYKRHLTMLIGIVAFIFIMLLGIIAFLQRRFLIEHFKRREVTKALEEESEKLGLATQDNNAFVWTLRNDRLIFESAFWQYLDLEPRDFDLRFALTLIDPMSRVNFEKQKQDIISGKIKSLELQCNITGHKATWWEFRYSKFKKEHGKYKTTGLVYDIQPQKDMEEELNNAKMNAEKAELKHAFLDRMSNEIRTPLNAIVGFTDILESEKTMTDANRKKYAGIINDNNRIMVNMIDEALLISQIESDSIQFDNHDCSVDKIISKLYQQESHVIPQKIQFLKEKIGVEKSQDLIIDVDEAFLLRALKELVNNAINSTPEGYIKIGYQYHVDNGTIELFVEDSGIGISENKQNKIFDQFYKVDRFSQGVGMGLTICKLIVDKLKGELKLQSKLGKGSRFSIVLPSIQKK